MGTLNYSVGTYGRDTARTLKGTRPVGTGGAFATTTSAATVSGLSLDVGQVISLHADVAMWVAFGGRTAAIGTDQYIPANTMMEFEVSVGDDGAVSARDVA